MENSVFNNAHLPQTFLHLEVLKSVDELWPEGIPFRDVFVFHMPVTRKLLSYLEEFNTKPVPEWMYLAYPETKQLLQFRDPYMVLQMDLATIMKLENVLNPNAIPYPVSIWLKHIEEARKKFQTIEILKKDMIAFTVPGFYCNATLTVQLSPNFPFEPPILEGNFLDLMPNTNWVANKTTLKMFFQRYTEHIQSFEEIFEYVSSICVSGARVILINDNGEPFGMNQMQDLQIKQNRFLELFCKFPAPSLEMVEIYAEVVINIDSFDPHKIIILPKNLRLVADGTLWRKDNSLEQNLYDCVIGEKVPMFE